jgi:hypothetical protein
MIVVHGGDGSHSYRKLTRVDLGGGATHGPAGPGREPIVSAPKASAFRIQTTMMEPEMTTNRAFGLVLAVVFAALPVTARAADTKPAAASAASRDVIVQASSLPKSALSEWLFLNDPLSPGGKMVGTLNSGGDLDPPPEEDPHVIFKIKVEGGVPYRCWVHMKVGTPKGVSKANKLWLQFTKAVDAKGKETLKPGSESYLTAVGTNTPGWLWVPCTAAGEKAPGALLTFKGGGEITVRVQAGMEGVGFDQLVLSPARFLEQAPTEAVVEKK